MDFTTYFADEASTLNHFYHHFYDVGLLEKSAVFLEQVLLMLYIKHLAGSLVFQPCICHALK